MFLQLTCGHDRQQYTHASAKLRNVGSATLSDFKMLGIITIGELAEQDAGAPSSRRSRFSCTNSAIPPSTKYCPSFVASIAAAKPAPVFLCASFLARIAAPSAGLVNRYCRSASVAADVTARKGVNYLASGGWLRRYPSRTSPVGCLRHLLFNSLGLRWLWTLSCSEICLTRSGLIPTPGNQNPCAQSRNPIDIIFQGRSAKFLQAQQQWSTIFL